MIEFFIGVGSTLMVEYGIAQVALWVKAKKEAALTAVTTPTLESILDATDGWRKVPEKVGQAVEAVQDSIEKVKDTKGFVEGKLEDLKEGAQEVLQDSKEFIQDAVDEVQEKVGYGSQYVKETFHDVKERFIGKTDEPTANNGSVPPAEKV